MDPISDARRRLIQHSHLDRGSRRDIEKQKNVETTEVERTLAVELAQVAKQTALIATLREQQTAEIQKKQAIEVAERDKEVAVAVFPFSTHGISETYADNRMQRFNSRSQTWHRFRGLLASDY